jgi:hypothetical protein
LATPARWQTGILLTAAMKVGLAGVLIVVASQLML